mgnify:CR=1 FL=1
MILNIQRNNITQIQLYRMLSAVKQVHRFATAMNRQYSIKNAAVPLRLSPFNIIHQQRGYCRAVAINCTYTDKETIRVYLETHRAARKKSHAY